MTGLAVFAAVVIVGVLVALWRYRATHRRAALAAKRSEDEASARFAAEVAATRVPSFEVGQAAVYGPRSIDRPRHRWEHHSDTEAWDVSEVWVDEGEQRWPSIAWRAER